MNAWYKTLVGLMWLALPVTALNYWSNWDQLPQRMAVHFNANWQPNGYTTREGSLTMGLGIMAFMLVVFTIGLLVVQAQKPAAAWPLLLTFYVALGFLWFGNYSIVKWNLNPPARSESVGPKSPAVSDSNATKFLTLYS